MNIFTAAHEGLSFILTEVETDITRGLPSFTIVGLGDTSIKEARERIRSAVKNSGFTYPMQRKTINLTPAHIKKHGSLFDLPIALSLLVASGQASISKHKVVFCAGELKLNGSVRSFPGVLPLVHFAKRQGFKEIFVPYSSLEEALLVKGIRIYPVLSLEHIVSHLNGIKKIKPKERAKRNMHFIKDAEGLGDFDAIIGNEIPKRALSIAAAGMHHILLVGPPGTGKTHLAKSFKSILPPLSHEDSLEASMIHSVGSGMRISRLPLLNPPFRHIHHTTTAYTLMGGGNPIKVGEVSLAHKGVLFLDEFAEFPPNVLNMLREPLQEGVVRIGRKGKTALLPAQFQLIATMNPCACGYRGDSHKNCQCTPYQIRHYYKRISGPILDRIDLVVEVPRISGLSYKETQKNASSSELCETIIQARKMQSKRQILNRAIQLKDIHDKHLLNAEVRSYLQSLADRMHLSPRAYISIVRVARTIADLEQAESIQKNHIAEAVQYRNDFMYT